MRKSWLTYRQAVLNRAEEAVTDGIWSPKVLAALFRSEDLLGKRVLDMGANTGGLSLELARMGARVVAAEPLVDTGPARRIAEEEGLTIEWSKAGLFDSRALGPFDTIICFGLLYHFRNPQYVLDYLSSLGSPVLYLSCQTIPGDGLVMQNRNETGLRELSSKTGIRGWEPTHRMLRAMMGAAGFGEIALLTDRAYNLATGRPSGLTNSAYYRAVLGRRVDPDLMNITFEAR